MACHLSAHQHGLVPGMAGTKVWDKRAAHKQRGRDGGERGDQPQGMAKLVWTEGLESHAGKGLRKLG